MPLNILYLLGDHGIPLYESKKGASIHARCIIEAMRSDRHTVRIACMRKGKTHGPEEKFIAAAAKPSKATRKLVHHCIAPCERGEIPLQHRLGEILSQVLVLTLCVASGLTLLIRNLFLLQEPATGLFSLSTGLILLAGALPACLLIRYFSRAMRRLLWPNQTHEPSNFILALFTLLRQRDFHRVATRQISHLKKPRVLFARNAWFAYPYLSLKKKFNIPLILEVNAITWIEKANRGEAALQKLCKWIEKRNLQGADLVVAVSETVRQQAIAAGALPENTITLPNRADTHHFEHPLSTKRPPQYEGKFVVGLVCSFRPFHGAPLLIQAAKLLKGKIPNLLISIIGVGPEAQKVRQMVSDEGLQDIISLEGTRAYEILPQFLSHFDIATAPYTGTQNIYGSPMKIYEYMAAGKPVVSARWGEAEKFLVDRQTALFHEPGNAKDLAEKILEIHNDPDLAASIANQGRQYVQDRTWTANIRKIFSWLEDRQIIPPQSGILDEGERIERLLREEIARADQWADYDAQRAEAIYNDPSDPSQDAEENDLLNKPAHKFRNREQKRALVTGRLQVYLYNRRLKNLTRRAEKLEAEIEPIAPRKDEPLRILRICSSGSMGGVAKVMNQTILRFDPQEVHTTALIFGPKDHISPRLQNHPGAQYIRIPMEMWLPSWDRRIFASIRKITKIIQENKIDLVHLHEPNFAPAVRIASAQAGVPAIVHLHSAYSTRREKLPTFHKSLERKAMRDLPLIACSQNMIDDAYLYIGHKISAKQKPIDLVLDGTDDLPIWERAEKLEKWINDSAGERKKFILIGRFIPLKRIPDYMMACRILMDEGEPLFMILIAYGKEREMKRARYRFRQMFKPGEAELLYQVADPSNLMEHVHAGISCSTLEGLPVTLLEYMHNKVPVLCSDITAHRQIIKHEENGLLFTPCDLPSILRAMRRILHDDALREKITQNAQDSIKDREWEKTAKKTLDIYKRILYARTKNPEKQDLRENA